MLIPCIPSDAFGVAMAMRNFASLSNIMRRANPQRPLHMHRIYCKGSVVTPRYCVCFDTGKITRNQTQEKWE